MDDLTELSKPLDISTLSTEELTREIENAEPHEFSDGSYRVEASYLVNVSEIMDRITAQLYESAAYIRTLSLTSYAVIATLVIFGLLGAPWWLFLGGAGYLIYALSQAKHKERPLVDRRSVK